MEVFGDVASFVHLAQRARDLLELVCEQQENATLDGVRQHEVVHLRCIGLTVAVDTSDALLGDLG